MFPGETIMSGADAAPASEFKVMQSAAGYYIGTTYYDEEMGGDFPYSRETGYFGPKAAAEAALATYVKHGVLPQMR